MAASETAATATTLPDRLLVTGAAGFIGSHLVDALLERGCRVVGLDLPAPPAGSEPPPADGAAGRRRANLAAALARDTFELVEGDVRDDRLLVRLCREHGIQSIVHLAARTGVRPSLAQPRDCLDVNVGGTAAALQAAVDSGARQFLLASSSSVYGNQPARPLREDDPAVAPISPYAASKRAAELVAHAFHAAHGLPVTCLRFFTVYGPRQRPDLAIDRFLRRVAAGEAIEQYGDGTSARDYTAIDDAVRGVLAAAERCRDGFRIYNLGSGRPIALAELIATVGRVVGREPRVRVLPPQPGDVAVTWADLARSRAELGYEPRTPFAEGVARQWRAMQQGA